MWTFYNTKWLEDVRWTDIFNAFLASVVRIEFKYEEIFVQDFTSVSPVYIYFRR